MTKKKEINVLGSIYQIVEKGRNEDDILQKADGYCDVHDKKIVIDKSLNDPPEGTSTKNKTIYKNLVLRHEVIHSIFYESGLHDECSFARDEELVDWIAIQFPKMLKLFTQLGVLE